MKIVHYWKPLTVWIPLWPRIGRDSVIKTRVFIGIVSKEGSVNQDRGFFHQEAPAWKDWGFSSAHFNFCIMYMK